MMDLWSFIEQGLKSGEAITLLAVTQHQGSTPGKRGFMMAVDGNGGMFGTIGGGRMERNLVERARAMAGATAGPTAELVKQEHRENAAPEHRSGMICAGTQWIALVWLTEAALPWLQTLRQRREIGLTSSLTLSPAGATVEAQPSAPQFKDGPDWLYRELIPPPDTIYIIGSGHVGLALTRVMATLDFRVEVIDDRPDVKTFVENNHADRKRCIPYHTIGEVVPEGDHVYAVVVTTDFNGDLTAIRELIGKNLRFRGLMGSAAKIQRIFTTLSETDGHDLAWIKQKVQAPVGIPLPNRTPAEIAISIAAQIIQVKGQGRGVGKSNLSM